MRRAANQRGTRGVTLVELMVALAIMLVGIAVMGAVLISGAAMQRNAEVQGDEADSARLAMTDLVNAVQLAGNGAPSGLYVVPVSSAVPSRIGAVFSTDGTTLGIPNGSDDLWVVVPDKNVLQEPCVAGTGASTMVTAPSSGTDSVVSAAGSLYVSCTTGFNAGDLLMATNLTSGALLSGTVFTPPSGATPPAISFAEQLAGLSDAPGQGGFKAGDLVYRAFVYHFFVKNDAAGNPGLYRSRGALTGVEPAGLYPVPMGYPFVDADPGQLVAGGRGVEDLQVVFGVDTNGDGQPDAWVHGMTPADARVAGSGDWPPRSRRCGSAWCSATSAS